MSRPRLNSQRQPGTICPLKEKIVNALQEASNSYKSVIELTLKQNVFHSLTILVLLNFQMRSPSPVMSSPRYLFNPCRSPCT